jgi:hypothetical protein
MGKMSFPDGSYKEGIFENNVFKCEREFNPKNNTLKSGNSLSD